MMKNKNEVMVFNLVRSFKKWENVVKNVALFVLEYEKVKNSYLEIYFINKEEIKALNKVYKNKNKETNILSFPYFGKVPRPDLKGRKFLGEIFLSPSFIKERKEDISYLTIHGVLHILGYTHSNKKNAIIMNKKEKEVLLALQKNV